MHKITLIPGDGIGPEVTEAARRCIDSTGVKVEWEEVIAGQNALDKTGEILPQNVLDSIKKNRIALKGPIVTPIGEGFRSVNVAIRHSLDLYACLRPTKSYPGVRSHYQDIDLVIIRENSEDLYAGIEFEKGLADTANLISVIQKHTKKKIRDDSGISIKPISVYASERIVRFAFDYALSAKRKKVTVITKANIMKFTDGLFLKTAREVAKEYKGKFLLAKVDVEEASATSEKFGISSIPAVKMFKNGKVVSEFTGSLPEDSIKKWLDENL